MENEKVYITLERFKSLKQEVRSLKTKERKVIADKLSEYRDSVDLLEDTSYNDLLLEQADLEAKIDQMEELLEKVSIIKKTRSVKVQVGSIVELRRIGERKIKKITIVGSYDANPLNGTISNESPLGKELIGKKKDEVATINSQNGPISYKIISIK